MAKATTHYARWALDVAPYERSQIETALAHSDLPRIEQGFWLDRLGPAPAAWRFMAWRRLFTKRQIVYMRLAMEDLRAWLYQGHNVEPDGIVTGSKSVLEALYEAERRMGLRIRR